MPTSVAFVPLLSPKNNCSASRKWFTPQNISQVSSVYLNHQINLSVKSLSEFIVSSIKCQKIVTNCNSFYHSIIKVLILDVKPDTVKPSLKARPGFEWLNHVLCSQLSAVLVQVRSKR